MRQETQNQDRGHFDRSDPAPEGLIRPGHLVLPDEGFSLPDLEREIILKALERQAGNRSATARYLGIPRHVLLYRLKKYEREGS